MTTFKITGRIIEEERVLFDGSEEEKARIEKELQAGYYIAGEHVSKGKRFLKIRMFDKEQFFELRVRPYIRATLDVTDVMMISDNYNKLSAEQQQDLLIFREQLRNFTNDLTAIDKPVNIEIPAFPESLQNEYKNYEKKYIFLSNLYVEFGEKYGFYIAG